MDSLGRALGAVEGEVHRVRSVNLEVREHGGSWHDVLGSVLALQDAVRGLRARVRAKATKEKRRTCEHPEERRLVYFSGTVRCKACGKQWRP